MRFSLVLALALASLTIPAIAQKHQKPKAKPSYNEEKQNGKGGARAVKEPTSRSSSAQELRRVEQSGARATASKKTESGKAARTNAALKGQKKDENPPIRFASSGGSGHGSKGKTGDQLKGRMRHKGSHH
jgi:hypothetical protein